MDDSTSIFEIVTWAGAFISVVGLAGLILSIFQVARARRAKLPDDELRAAVQKAMPLNLGAFFLSVLGLMMVVVGVFLAP